MTSIAILAITENGKQLAKKINQLWDTELPIFVPEKHADKDAIPFQKGGFRESIADLFQNYQALICIMATGIVVRSIAEVVNDKRVDPAVLVVDEKGENVISLLSGHIGGGNQLTRQLAEKLQANPVITTATDVQEVTAVDLLAQEINGWYADFKETTKKINGYLAAHQKVAIVQKTQQVSDLRGLTILDKITNANDYKVILLISSADERIEDDNVIQIVPRQFVLGMGAKKNISLETIKTEYALFCQQEGIHPYAVKKVVSIDLKKEETGIIQFAEWLEVPFETYEENELSEVAEKYPQSDFVKKITGVGSVALAAADLASKGQVISQRYGNNGVTFALGKE